MAAALGPTALGRFLWAAFQSLWAFWGGVGDFRSVKRRLRGGIRGASRDVRSAKWRHGGERAAHLRKRSFPSMYAGTRVWERAHGAV